MARRSRLAPVLAEIIALRNEGWSLQEIGDRFGVTREAIRVVLRNAGVAPRHVGRERGEVAKGARAEARAAKVATRAARPKHGTRYYYDRGCRCEDCLAAKLAYFRELRQRCQPPQHGTISGYRNHGCRCRACKSAGAADNRANRHLRIMRGQA